jgi:acyl carrier protein
MALIDDVKAVIMDKLGADAEKIVPEARFIEDLGADSLDTVELVMGLEDKFDLEISDEDAEKIRTVQDAISFVTAKQA